MIIFNLGDLQKQVNQVFRGSNNTSTIIEYINEQETVLGLALTNPRDITTDEELNELMYSLDCGLSESIDRPISSKKEFFGSLNRPLEMIHLEECFNKAIENTARFVGVHVTTPVSDEVIVIRRLHFDKKMEYYKSAYTDITETGITLKSNNGVKIIGFTFGNSFEEIGADLL